MRIYLYIFSLLHVPRAVRGEITHSCVVRSRFFFFIYLQYCNCFSNFYEIINFSLLFFLNEVIYHKITKKFQVHIFFYFWIKFILGKWIILHNQCWSLNFIEKKNFLKLWQVIGKTSYEYLLLHPVTLYSIRMILFFQLFIDWFFVNLRGMVK